MKHPEKPGENARGLALHVLLNCRQQDAFVQELLDRELGRSSLSPVDRRLATQLTYGVLRRSLAALRDIDHRLSAHPEWADLRRRPAAR